MTPTVKICGLSTPETLDAALEAGADMVGLVRFPRSPRHVELDAGGALAARARGRVGVVALLVDPDDDELARTLEALRPDLLQLHGRESPERVAAIRARFGVPVMKAVGIADEGDVAGLHAYAAVADRLLVDAKPPRTAGALPGGNGLSFDWRLVTGLDLGKPLMLSGGLDPANVAAALRLTRIGGVDVSSGVESAPGIKDRARIAAFVEAAKGA
ncbi:phosphoribosylanthranilate isomerase [Salinarimonas soli]|uniref:N-(5'-phosphoribosyl)anthranilate isomerase n=1 Tax=Salinarimonas soli TaxID=1638099 RepID=A0A5B2VFK2_9HYPH|nr:phosphoribosylanthranilate isomerase [Salinarimonas soli]KAA2237901.1 phosphoribosylanthranilate isomerase [Salinarimonas soli]